MQTDGAKIDWCILLPASIPQFTISIICLWQVVIIPAKGDEPIAATTAIKSKSVHNVRYYNSWFFTVEKQVWTHFAASVSSPKMKCLIPQAMYMQNILLLKHWSGHGIVAGTPNLTLQ